MKLTELKEHLQRYADENGTRIRVEFFGGDETGELIVTPLEFRPELRVHHTDVG